MQNNDAVWLTWGRNLLAIAKNGLTFTKDQFDRERFVEIEKIAKDIISVKTNMAPERLEMVLVHEKGYTTPKVDVRGGVFRDNKVLLVRER